MRLSVGDKAPDFYAKDQNETEHRLLDYKGKWLLLYFYPRDGTPGCTTEACSFRDSHKELSKYLEVVGVSANSIESHSRFSEKHQLPFPILADTEKKMLADFGADGLVFAKRTSFLINPEGKIVKIYEKVKPAEHAAEILKDIKEIK